MYDEKAALRGRLFRRKNDARGFLAIHCAAFNIRLSGQRAAMHTIHGVRMSSHLTRTLTIAVLLSGFAANDVRAQDRGAAPVGPYDFLPGDRILYAEDFQATLGAASAIRRLAEATQRISIEPRGGRPFLHARPPASFAAILKEPLPEQFTIDFDMHIPGSQVLRILTSETDPQSVIEVGPHSVAVAARGAPRVSAQIDRIIRDFDESRTMHYSIAFGRPGVRIYVGDQQVLFAPGIDIGRSDKVRFDFPGTSDSASIDRNIPIWISDIRIASGSSLSYAELAAKGRIATGGISFDVNDRIRPESAPTLKAIADMLAAHPDLKLTIEGHTDNFGSSTINYAMSDRRAKSVKDYLVANFKVDDSRLAGVGMGDTKPVALNSNPTGRRQNRRIELVKQ